MITKISIIGVKDHIAKILLKSMSETSNHYRVHKMFNACRIKAIMCHCVHYLCVVAPQMSCFNLCAH